LLDRPPGCFVDNGGNLSYPDNTRPGIVGDPKLGPLADNGGATKTMELLGGSRAINAAACDYVTIDQRLLPRPQGVACDIGAYEKSPIAFTGFFAPVSNPPLVNIVNVGRAKDCGGSRGTAFAFEDRANRRRLPPHRRFPIFEDQVVIIRERVVEAA
jgi:hypothetical protein